MLASILPCGIQYAIITISKALAVVIPTRILNAIDLRSLNRSALIRLTIQTTSYNRNEVVLQRIPLDRKI
ncbi:hypothetical protein D3C73_1121590 [compost metagenome]